MNWSKIDLPQIKKYFYSPTQELTEEESQNYRKLNDIINNTEMVLPPPITKFEHSGIS
jgi:hypothetical protein